MPCLIPVCKLFAVCLRPVTQISPQCAKCLSVFGGSHVGWLLQRWLAGDLLADTDASFIDKMFGLRIPLLEMFFSSFVMCSSTR